MRDRNIKILLSPRVARVYAGLGQVEAAKRLDLSANTLVGYEKGRKVEENVLKKMAEVYGLNEDDFLLQ